jgi:hypothetical protein
MVYYKLMKVKIEGIDIRMLDGLLLKEEACYNQKVIFKLK